jgi:TonB family protein
MSIQGVRQQAVRDRRILDNWKQWEGQAVDGRFPLRRYLGGYEHTGVFLTHRGKAQAENATIKLVLADANPDFAEMQLSRWAILTRLSHPRLIQVFEAGRCRLGEHQMLFVVTEYGDESLSQVLPYRPLTQAEARDLLSPVVEGLAHLHSMGLAHGRLKPANIMAVNEEVKLACDGACPMGQAVFAQPSVYDAPEVTPNGTSAAADVWSLGATLVEGLTQQLPVNDGAGDPLLPEQLPSAFSNIARRCLRRTPQSRWSLPELARELRPAPPPEAPMSISPELRSALSVQAPEAPGLRRYVAPAVIATLVAVLLFFGIRSLTHRAPAPATESPAAASAPAPTPQSPAETQPGQANPNVAPTPETAQVPPAQAETKAPGVADQQANTPAKVPDSSDSAPATSLPSTAADQPTGAAVAHGRVARQVLPEASRRALATIWGTVRVSVKAHVDASGHVTSAAFDSPGPSRYFSDLTLQAAKQWTFNPPETNGQTVPSEWLLHFRFTKGGATVVPEQITP